MNNIESFNLHNLHNVEHFQFLTDVDDLITNLLPTELGLTEVYPPFKGALAVEAKAIKVEQGSLKSEAIEVANKRRGTTWNAIKRKINANLISPIEGEVQSAERIYHILKQYNDPRKLIYQEATGAITSLVSDLQLPANAADLEKLVLTVWIGELKKQNDAFQTLFKERNTEYAERESGDVQGPRQVIDPLYKKIVSTVNATIELKLAKPAAATFVSELNQHIKYYKTVLSSRDSRNNRKKDNGDNTPPAK